MVDHLDSCNLCLATTELLRSDLSDEKRKNLTMGESKVESEIKDNHPDLVKFYVYYHGISLIEASKYIDFIAEHNYPGISKTHEIENIKGYSGLPHGDYGFTFEITMKKARYAIKNETTNLILGG